jgi:hypothetical protein
MSAQQPMLMDEVIPSLAAYTAKVARGSFRKDVERDVLQTKIDLRHAHRFLLDDSLVRHVTHVSSATTPQKLLQRLPSATLPYPTVWMEFNLHAKVQASAERAGVKANLTDTPERMGLLFKRDESNPSVWQMEVVANMRISRGRTFTVPFHIAYGLCPPGLNNKPHEKVQTAERVWASWGWGYSADSGYSGYDADDEPVMPECLEGWGRVAIATASRSMVLAVDAEVTAKAATTFAEDNAGLLRWAATALAILSEVPTHVSDEVQPSGRKMVAGAAKPLLSYRRLTLHLPLNKDPVRYINRKLDHAVVARKRAHDVRGHWRNYHLVEGCEHTWQQADEDPTYRRCTSCGGFSRFIAEHVRGDATLGWVKKEYVLAGVKA